MQEMSLEPACEGVPIAWTVASWQFRHLASVTFRLLAVIRIGS
jgi:hypothetical protein